MAYLMVPLTNMQQRCASNRGYDSKGGLLGSLSTLPQSTFLSSLSITGPLCHCVLLTSPSCLIFAIILYHPTDLCYFLSSSSACFLFPFLSLAFFCLSFIFSSLGTRRPATHHTPFLHNKSTHCHTPDINPRPQSQ